MMSSYDGLYQTNPKLAFLMTLALFSLAGIPPFAGMFSKFFVFMAAAEQGSFWAAFRTELSTRVALILCTAGIVLFGVCSCIYDYLFAASAM